MQYKIKLPSGELILNAFVILILENNFRSTSSASSAYSTKEFFSKSTSLSV